MIKSIECPPNIDNFLKNALKTGESTKKSLCPPGQLPGGGAEIFWGGRGVAPLLNPGLDILGEDMEKNNMTTKL